MYDTFLKIINKKGGVITSKDAVNNGISRTMLKKMNDTNYIKRIEYGIYVTDDFIYDEYYIFQLKHKDSIFSHNTSLYFQEMTERTPSKMDITVKRSTHLSSLEDKINLYRVNESILGLGKIQIKTPYNHIVTAYNKERTVCDLINNKSDLDIELVNKSIRNCIKSKDFNANEMLEYSKKMKIYEKVKNYMEAIL